MGGLLAMLIVSTAIWSAVCACSFEFARAFRAYDYRSFFRELLGWAWPSFEICYFALVLIILAVIAAAAGSILQETFGLHYAIGVVGMMAAVGYLVFRGSGTIEKFLAGWSFLLYGVYIVFFVWAFTRFGGDTISALASGERAAGWPIGGVEYAAYNLAVIPAVLFCTRHMHTRREAVTAGLLAGPIAIVPGFLFYMTIVGQYPDILESTVPANYVLELIGSRWFQLAFQVVLFGTLVETGTGLIHAVNERIAKVYAERDTTMPVFLRPMTALILLAVGALLAQFGLIGLIASGYGTLTWIFLVIFVVPVLTWGVWKISRHGATTSVIETEMSSED